jgi:hypothetical protein
VKNWFQSFPFKCNLHRYNAATRFKPHGYANVHSGEWAIYVPWWGALQVESKQVDP